MKSCRVNRLFPSIISSILISFVFVCFFFFLPFFFIHQSTWQIVVRQEPFLRRALWQGGFRVSRAAHWDGLPKTLPQSLCLLAFSSITLFSVQSAFLRLSTLGIRSRTRRCHLIQLVQAPCGSVGDENHNHVFKAAVDLNDHQILRGLVLLKTKLE